MPMGTFFGCTMVQYRIETGTEEEVRLGLSQNGCGEHVRCAKQIRLNLPVLPITFACPSNCGSCVCTQLPQLLVT